MRGLVDDLREVVGMAVMSHEPYGDPNPLDLTRRH
jgi:hypothetical protein